MAVRFSLICPSLNRTHEVERLLASLTRQRCQHFELIIVDQNEDDRLGPIVEAHRSTLAIRRIHSQRGASRGRNAGLALARGDLIAFPDDDCWYPEDLFERVNDAFAAQPALDILTGIALGEDGLPIGRWDRQAGPITPSNVWRRGIAFALFLRRSASERIGGFDETLGPGSGTPFGAGEETDFLLRALAKGCTAHYDPGIVTYHPNKKFTEIGLVRAFGYGAGMGRVLRRHRAAMGDVGKAMARPLGGVAVSALRGHLHRSRYHWATFQGRLSGYFARPG